MSVGPRVTTSAGTLIHHQCRTFLVQSGHDRHPRPPARARPRRRCPRSDRRGRALVGYGRVPTKGQNLDRQIFALRGAVCQTIFADKKSGKNVDP
ncbi:recombinase family protein [Nocardia pseudovaccinii]|uniref:recombinase family protein n=1 Tax=Nocardia pseudovaccinii TaxID=189540 RepID=UPI0035A22A15